MLLLEKRKATQDQMGLEKLGKRDHSQGPRPLQKGHWGAENNFGGGPWDDVEGGHSQQKRQPQQGL